MGNGAREAAELPSMAQPAVARPCYLLRSRKLPGLTLAPPVSRHCSCPTFLREAEDVWARCGPCPVHWLHPTALLLDLQSLDAQVVIWQRI